MIPDELLRHCYRMESRMAVDRAMSGLDMEKIFKSQCAEKFVRNILDTEDLPITTHRPDDTSPCRSYYKMEITRFVLTREMMQKFFDYARTGVWNDG